MQKPNNFYAPRVAAIFSVLPCYFLSLSLFFKLHSSYCAKKKCSKSTKQSCTVEGKQWFTGLNKHRYRGVLCGSGLTRRGGRWVAASRLRRRAHTPGREHHRAPWGEVGWGGGSKYGGEFVCVFLFGFFHRQGYILFSVSECESFQLLSVQGSSKSVVAIKEARQQSLCKTEGNMAACWKSWFKNRCQAARGLWGVVLPPGRGVVVVVVGVVALS